MNITRFHTMDKIDLDVEFLTPTFLGGADQQAELRSAPFKNLLRQWWRVVNGNLAADALRTREGELFGTVLGDDECTSSRVRIALAPGQPFAIHNQPFQLGVTHHPEVGQNGMNVQNSLYLGFGPITSHGGLIFRKYISPGSLARISVTFPRQNRNEIVRALQYVDAFGAIGSRCRNGYGSLSFSSDAFGRLDPATLQTNEVEELVANNAKEYPNRFGGDEQGILLWDAAQNGWEGAMTLLAGTYLRTRTKINIAGNPNELHERHLLGFPITNHNKIQDWGGRNGRMPSQLRLMVKRDTQNRLVARILHLPHRLPNDKQWPNQLPSQYEVWQQVHRFLDAQNQFHRIGGAA